MSSRRYLDVDTIENFDKEYTIQEKLGQGYESYGFSVGCFGKSIYKITRNYNIDSYGAVFLAKHNKTETLVAIKSLYCLGVKAQEIDSEIEIMRECDSDHIVRYFGRFVKDNYLWIVMEYCKYGSCRDILNFREAPFNEIEISRIITDALSGLAYLHRNNKMHRDIKADNIMMNQKGECKLGDFGVSGSGEHMKTVIGTPYFLAPEVIMNAEGFYTNKVDIWSLGITCIELAEMNPPHWNEQPMKVLFSIPNKPSPTLTKPEEFSSEFNDFIAQCLIKDPDQRPSAEKLLKHKFMDFAMAHFIAMSPLMDSIASLQAMDAAAALLQEQEQQHNASASIKVDPKADSASTTATPPTQATNSSVEKPKEVEHIPQPAQPPQPQQPPLPPAVERERAPVGRKTSFLRKTAGERKTGERRGTEVGFEQADSTSALGKTLQQIMDEENSELERRIDAEIKKREDEEKAKIAHEAKSGKDSKIRRLSVFLKLHRPDKKTLVDQGVIKEEPQKDAEKKEKNKEKIQKFLEVRVTDGQESHTEHQHPTPSIGHSAPHNSPPTPLEKKDRRRSSLFGKRKE